MLSYMGKIEERLDLAEKRIKLLMQEAEGGVRLSAEEYADFMALCEILPDLKAAKERALLRSHDAMEDER